MIRRPPRSTLFPLHDALPIFQIRSRANISLIWRKTKQHQGKLDLLTRRRPQSVQDRKSTRLNSSHSQISYAVFCLKKKNTQSQPIRTLRDKRYVSAMERALLL